MYNNWSPRQIVDDSERARLAELNKRPAPNPPALLAPVRIRVLKSFYACGRRLEVNEIVELQRHDALSMRALGKVKLLED